MLLLFENTQTFCFILFPIFFVGDSDATKTPQKDTKGERSIHKRLEVLFEPQKLLETMCPKHGKDIGGVKFHDNMKNTMNLIRSI